MTERENLEQIGHAMMLAWQRVKKAQARMWGDWMTIGEGLLEGRRWAMQMAGTNKPEGKGYVMAYAEWLKRYKVDDMDKSDRAKLLQLMEERPGVEEWRATLTDYDRRNLNNPTIAWRKWTAATRVKKPKPRSAGVSATEHGRAQGTIDQQQARIEELEEELSARPTAEPEPKTLDDWCLKLSGLVTNAFGLLSATDRAGFLAFLKAVVETEERKHSPDRPQRKAEREKAEKAARFAEAAEEHAERRAKERARQTKMIQEGKFKRVGIGVVADEGNDVDR
jgi:hypothetical protein